MEAIKQRKLQEIRIVLQDMPKATQEDIANAILARLERFDEIEKPTLTALTKWTKVEDGLPYVSKNTLVAYKTKHKMDYKAYTMRVRNMLDLNALIEVASEWIYITKSNE